MNLLTPLGLLALIGLPLIVIIYILKPKYQEKTINSTYIWRLSLKYRKRKVPLQWLKRSLLLIVQLLIMSVFAFMIAQPFIKHPKPQYERIIILDASASMLAVDSDGKTRFDKAKEDILKEAEESSQEFDMSIILCNDKPEWIVQNAFTSGGANTEDSSSGENDAKKALGVNKISLELNKAQCTSQPCDYSAAIKLADEYRQANPDAKILLYTDHDFTQKGYVEVVNFSSSSEWNASIVSVEERKGEDEILFDVTVGSFMKTGEVTLSVEITGINGISTLKESRTFSFKNNDTQTLTIKGDDDDRISSYEQAKFLLTTPTGAAIKDSYKYDNEYYCFGSDSEIFDVWVEIDQAENITTEPYVLKALSSSDNINLYEVSARRRKEMEELAKKTGSNFVYPDPQKLTGNDLYVYDGKMPNILPSDGASWFVNVPTDWALGKNSLGVTIGNPSNKTDKENMYTIDPVVISGESKKSVLVKSLNAFRTIGMLKASQYRPITIADDNPYNFEPILTINGETVMVAGENARGVRVVITSLDFSLTTLPLAPSTVLAKNVVDYCVSETLDVLSYEVGETVEVYSKPTVDSATVSVAGSDEKPWEFSKAKQEFPVSFTATLPGVYTVALGFEDTDDVVESKFFVHLNADECNFSKVGGFLAANDGSQTAGDALANSEIFDMEDITFWFAVAIMALLLLEWGLQYREQY